MFLLRFGGRRFQNRGSRSVENVVGSKTCVFPTFFFQIIMFSWFCWNQQLKSRNSKKILAAAGFFSLTFWISMVELRKTIRDARSGSSARLHRWSPRGGNRQARPSDNASSEGESTIGTARPRPTLANRPTKKGCTQMVKED